MKARLKCFVVLCSVIFSCANVFAQEYPVSTIADSLKENASAVVRKSVMSFSQKDMNNGTYKVTEVITVLNKDGDGYSNFWLYDDKFRSLSSFSGVLRNASGQIIRKIKKGDLVSSSITMDAGTLASDNVLITYECKSPAYPYTIEYNYEQKWQNGILSYPAFVPRGGYALALEHAEYSIDAPNEVSLRYKANYESNIKEQASPRGKVYTISVQNQRATQAEGYSPSSRETLPLVFFAPSEFCFDSFCGNMADWKSYGLWINNLTINKDIIPVELEAKLQALTKDLPTDREKVKAVYEYLQNNTRYVNIALGIGGYQPFDAKTVYRTNFGDCKALTNYMKSMLKSIGISSKYTLISTEIKDLYKDYPNFNQLNHVILLVPLKSDSIWLECTSSSAPFDYIGSSIAGHDALIISDEGGELCRLPSYSAEENKTVTNFEYTLAEDGSIKGKVSVAEHMGNSERINYMLRRNDREDIVRYLNANVKLSGIKFGELSTHNHLKERPFTKIETDFTMDNFANKTGARLFIPTCPLNKSNFQRFRSTKRNLPIKINYGYTEIDTVVVNLPQGYVLESLPPKINKEVLCGTFSTDVQVADGKIVYVQKVTILAGEYDVSEYKEIKNFFAQLVTVSAKKMVLRKQE